MTGWPVQPGALAAVAAVGVLGLAIFVGRAGSTVGLTVALVIATVLGIVAVVSLLATRLQNQRGRSVSTPPPHRRANSQHLSGDRPVPPGQVTHSPEPAPPNSEDVSPPTPAAPVPLTFPPPRREGAAAGPAVTEAAQAISQTALTEAGAPAAAVLIERDGALVQAGSAGDWAAVRRGLKDVAGPGLYDPSIDSGAPPEFPLDPRSDTLQQLLALFGRPIAVERWRELSDAPAPFLPLAGLAAAGTGVAIPLTHRRSLAGLWVVAQRPDGGPYSDAELSRLQQLSKRAAEMLATAISADGVP